MKDKEKKAETAREKIRPDLSKERARDASQTQTQVLTARDQSKEKSTVTAGLRATQTIASVESKGGKSTATTSSIPQNFNSYRHVITKATTGDDVQWILHLRDVHVRAGKVA